MEAGSWYQIEWLRRVKCSRAEGGLGAISVLFYYLPFASDLTTEKDGGRGNYAYLILELVPLQRAAPLQDASAFRNGNGIVADSGTSRCLNGSKRGSDSLLRVLRPA